MIESKHDRVAGVEQSKRTKRTGVKWMGNVVLFLLALVSVGAIADRLAPYVFPEAIQEKFDYFMAHKDEFDILFVGSSLIRNQLDPAVFDAVLAEHGHNVYSFNFAFGGMRFHEANALIAKILSTKPARLKWIVIGLARFDGPAPETRFMTDRYVWWHTPREALSATRRHLRSDLAPNEKRTFALAHLQHLGLRALQVGRGKELAGHVLGRRPKFSLRSIHLQHRGFVPRRRRVLDPVEYQAVFDEYRKARERPLELTVEDVRVLTGQAATVRAQGIEPVYVLPPLVLPELKALAAVEQGYIPLLFAYDDPDTYPAFYDPDHRWDAHHLDVEYSIVFTETFARDFAAYLDESR